VLNNLGDMVFLSFGWSLSMGKFGAYFSFGNPIVEKQNGQQADMNKRVVAGLSYAF